MHAHVMISHIVMAHHRMLIFFRNIFTSIFEPTFHKANFILLRSINPICQINNSGIICSFANHARHKNCLLVVYYHSLKKLDVSFNVGSISNICCILGIQILRFFTGSSWQNNWCIICS